MRPALKIEGVSKQYRLGRVGASSLRDDVQRIWAGLQRSPNPFLSRGEVNDRTKKSEDAYVWALKDINFTVKPGEVLGIIGKNGAGKSTLLKILSRITAPTTGKIEVNGRMASLLEVGTGFHPELTGRENIYLNGAILGMRRAEIKSKFDEIVDFSGVERYIDTPVKRYSSGMYVRLAFAVAAHLEPEILVVDEVLAVGDVDFQEKCINKMGAVSQNEGRTILFVSHNLIALSALCPQSILLENGTLVKTGLTTEIIQAYRAPNIDIQNQKQWLEDSTIRILNIMVYPQGAYDPNNLRPIEERNAIEILLELDLKESVGRYDVTWHLLAENGQTLFSFSTGEEASGLVLGKNTVACVLPEGFLLPGKFTLNLFVVQNGKKAVWSQTAIYSFVVSESPRDAKMHFGREPGHIKPKFNWRIA
jgi:lipopolysaccharide transport system ATP-binding protein